MSHYWDEFSRSLAEPLPRRDSLRRLGLVVAGAVLSPLGLRSTAAAHRPRQLDPCKEFCRCANRKQQDQCLRACRACDKDPVRLSGSCGNYVCCGAGLVACGDYCADLANDPNNCGACGYRCDPPQPNEFGGCLDGSCVYACVEGAEYCDGWCTFLDSDPDNCGACGNVCSGDTPYCINGACSDGEGPCAEGLVRCGGVCVDPTSDPNNCGACGVQCPADMICISGYCEGGGGGW